MSHQNSSAALLMLGTMLVKRLAAAASKARIVITCLQFPRTSSKRSNTQQRRALNTLLPARRKEPWEDMRLPGNRWLDKIRLELGQRPRGSHYLMIVNWSGGLTPERCWRPWGPHFLRAQALPSGRTAAR